MQAWVLTAPGSEKPLDLQELPTPVPAAGEVLVRLRAASLNYIDMAVITRSRPRPDFAPYIPGLDGAGTVEALGEGVTNWNPGDAVVINPWVTCGQCPACQAGEYADCPTGYLVGGYFGGPRSGGTFAQYMRVPARNLVPLPAHLSFAAAAALPTVLATAWQAVVVRGALKAGETVLIQGIGSGVSVQAMQVALALGARVIVTSSSAEKLARAREMGAHAGIHYRTEDVAQRVRELTDGRGADLAVDNAGKESFPASLAALRKRGRLVTSGATSGNDAALSLWDLIGKQATLMGVSSLDADFAAAMGFVAEQKLQPVYQAYPWQEIEQALQTMSAGAQFGKLVLEIR